jgi:tRNA A37 threonylcarbamoyladenosine dehydratase
VSSESTAVRPQPGRPDLQRDRFGGGASWTVEALVRSGIGTAAFVTGAFGLVAAGVVAGAIARGDEGVSR